MDQYEVVLGTNPLSPDTDGDGRTDGFEVKHGSNPRNPNSNPQYIQSLANGNWSAPTTWSCSCVPEAGDLVQIKANHIVTIDNNTATLETVLIEGKLNFTNGSKLNMSTK